MTDKHQPESPDRAALAGQEALVLGAGVAGLAVALALRRYGAEALVLEQAPEISEVGAGLQISPNGVRVLQGLGLDPAALGMRAEAVELCDMRGRLVTRMQLPAEPGFFLCHRADLVAGLAEALRAEGGRINLLQRVDQVTLGDGAQVEMRTVPGDRRKASLMIGADGLHSVLRGALNGAAAPVFTGQVAWRALIPGEGAAERPVVQVFMGPGRHLVSYPLRGGALRNLVAVEERNRWAAEGWNHYDDPGALRRAFTGFGGPVPGWLQAVREVLLWGLFRHPVAARWHDPEGRVAILGDAAHPTLPFLAQGANMALEDAWVLAAALASRPDDRGAALAHYQSLRAPRCAAIVRAADRNARAWHLRPPLAPVAHALVSLAGRVAPGLALGRFAWVHGHDATRVI
ncbi:MAG: FAD-dependent monooxygenase [Pararhodobacter sp.]|nr:FAD-dependent monooxygenase [Pararhodobacter sp.]